MDILRAILKWLSGKKSIIAGILNLTSAFLVLKGIIDADTGAYISGLILLIFGSASYATGKLVYNK
jgi:hypothetical protein